MVSITKITAGVAMLIASVSASPAAQLPDLPVPLPDLPALPGLCFLNGAVMPAVTCILGCVTRTAANPAGLPGCATGCVTGLSSNTLVCHRSRSIGLTLILINRPAFDPFSLDFQAPAPCPRFLSKRHQQEIGISRLDPTIYRLAWSANNRDQVGGTQAQYLVVGKNVYASQIMSFSTECAL